MATNFPKLIIMVGPNEGQEIELTGQDPIQIGRSDDNLVVLDDTSLSRHHASIQLKEDTWFIKDEGSRNGTYLNGSQLEPAVQTQLNHLDLIKLGIYEMRFATKAFTEEEAKNVKPSSSPTQKQEDNSSSINEEKEAYQQIETDQAPPTNTSFIEKPNETDLEDIGDEIEPIYRSTDDTKQKTGKSLLIFTIIALCFCLIGLAVFFVFDKNQKQNSIDELNENIVVEEEDTEEKTDTMTFAKEKQEEKDNIIKETTSDKDEDKNEDKIEKTAEETTTTTVTDKETKEDNVTFTPIALEPKDDTGKQQARQFSIILDIKTTPIPAALYFQGKRLCHTPCRETISVQANESYTLYADYELRELNDIYRKSITFKVKPETDVLEMLIDAELASLKVLKLPRHIEFYLEGYYDYDKLKAKPAKINDVVYGQPIYLPYGTYIVDLKERTKMAGSENYIKQVRFQREYHLNKEKRSITLKVSEKDLQFFPAVIKSIPPSADVYYAGEKVGVTPYTGLLPLGPNQLKVVKDGFFASVVDLDMRMNSVYETTIHLKTSKMGELINDAKEQIRNEQHKNAVDILIKALKYGGSSREKAEVYYLLGDVYVKQKEYDQAIPYLERAKDHDSFSQKASLSLVRAYHAQKQNIPALKLIVEVLANLTKETPAEIRAGAHSIFKLISPVKSVMYIYTEPSGARVFVNEKVVNQTTPLILSDLALGNYRLQIEKSGYATYKTKQNIKIGEFVLVKIRLKTEKL